VTCTECAKKPAEVRHPCWGSRLTTCYICDENKIVRPAAPAPITAKPVAPRVPTMKPFKSPAAVNRIQPPRAVLDGIPATSFIRMMEHSIPLSTEQLENTCGICCKCDDDAQVLCSDCGLTFHGHCLQRESLQVLPWLSESGAEFKCKLCLSACLSLPELLHMDPVEVDGLRRTKFKSHLGNSARALTVLTEIGKINMLRSAIDRVSLVKSRETLELEIVSGWKPQLLLLKVRDKVFDWHLDVTVVCRLLLYSVSLGVSA
jgi:hypothetical protein